MPLNKLLKALEPLYCKLQPRSAAGKLTGLNTDGTVFKTTGTLATEPLPLSQFAAVLKLNCAALAEVSALAVTKALTKL